MTTPLTRADVAIHSKTPIGDSNLHSRYITVTGGRAYLITEDNGSRRIGHHSTAGASTFAEPTDGTEDLALYHGTIGFGHDHEACIERLILWLNKQEAGPGADQARMARWGELASMNKPLLVALFNKTFSGRVAFGPQPERLTKVDLVGAILREEHPKPPCVYCGKVPNDIHHACPERAGYVLGVTA